VRERGWTPAGEQQSGDQLASLDGPWLAVDSLTDSGLLTTVYNFRVSNDHTYFVGTDEWGFSVWAHNAEYVPEALAQQVKNRDSAELAILEWIDGRNPAGRELLKNFRQGQNYDGYLPEWLIEENPSAHRVIAELVADQNPTNLIAIMRGGKLQTDILTKALPDLADRVRILAKNPDFRANEFAALRQAIDDIVTAYPGQQHRLVIVDTWFGGGTHDGIVKHVGPMLQAKRAAGVDVSLDVHFLRERIGYELSVGADPYAVRIVNGSLAIHEHRVRMVLGEDVKKLLDPWGDRTLRVFGGDGSVSSRIQATTRPELRSIFAEIMAGIRGI